MALALNGSHNPRNAMQNKQGQSPTQGTIDFPINRLIELELKRSIEIVREGLKVTPRFRIQSPAGDFRLYIQNVEDPDEHGLRMEMVQEYMRLKMAMAFVFSFETEDPHRIFGLYIGSVLKTGAFCDVLSSPPAFSEIKPIDENNIDPKLMKFLPDKIMEIDKSSAAKAKALMGQSGVTVEKL